MEPLIFALNAVLPVILMTLLGYSLGRSGVLKLRTARDLNKLCFDVFLPVMLFVTIYNTNSLSDIDWGISAFAVCGMTASFLAGLPLVLRCVPDRRQKGVVLQCVFRSNFSILGLPLALSLFGPDGIREAAVLSLFAIPVNNILSVISLRVFGGESDEKGTARGIALSIVSNRLIIGVLLGFAALCVRAVFERHGIAFRLKDVKFLYSALTSVASVTSPLALTALGALFTFSSVRRLWKQIVLASAIRVIAVPGVVLTVAYIFFPSFYGAPFAALIPLFASPVAVSSVVMAAEMGGDAELAGQLVVWTTLLSAFTIFAFVTVFRALGALS